MEDAFNGATEGTAKSVGCEMAVAAGWMFGATTSDMDDVFCRGFWGVSNEVCGFCIKALDDFIVICGVLAETCSDDVCTVIGFCTETIGVEVLVFSMASAMTGVSRFSRGSRRSRTSSDSRFSREAIGCNGVETGAFTVICDVLIGSCTDCVCTKIDFCTTDVRAEDFCVVVICVEGTSTEDLMFSMAGALAVAMTGF